VGDEAQRKGKEMKVHVYCCRYANYYGFGLNAKEAENAAVKAGADRKAKHVMCKMPQGVTECWVDDFGTLHWFGSDAQPTELAFDKKTRKWEPKEPEKSIA
jgi:hypothetical protein